MRRLNRTLHELARAIEHDVALNCNTSLRGTNVAASDAEVLHQIHSHSLRGAAIAHEAELRECKAEALRVADEVVRVFNAA